MDDCLGYLRKGGIESLMSRFRHYSLTLLVTCQNYMAQGPTLRYNAMYYVLFELNSKKELSKVIEEMEQLFPNFLEIYNKGLTKRYDFLFIDVRKQIIRKNFSSEILYQRPA